MQLRVGRAGSFILPDFATPAEKKRMKGTLCPLHSFWGGAGDTGVSCGLTRGV